MRVDRRFRNAFWVFLLFVIWTVLVRVVDTAAIGPMDTVVGFSGINGAVHAALGTNQLCYTLSSVLGILAIALCGVFAVIGLIQLIQRKKLLEVDAKLLVAGIIYICVILTYILFDKVAVNYRPVIMPDSTVPEASYPSTHAMLGCVSFGIGAMLLPEYIRNRKIASAARIICILCAALTVIFRLLSGVHWFTDILGGIIISAFFLMLYYAAAKKIDYLNRKKTAS